MKFFSIIFLLVSVIGFSQPQFYEIQNTPFSQLLDGTLEFADIDNDNDLDLLTTGNISGATPYSAQLFLNDGSGNFTEMMGLPFEQIRGGATKMVDVDGDNDLDVFIVGKNGAAPYIAKLYKNNGGGSFMEITNSFEGVGESSSIDAADIDGDNDIDVVIAGYNGTQRSTKLYKNDGAGNYTEVIGANLLGINEGEVAFVDIDNDNDMDLVIEGVIGTSSASGGKVYKNDGSGSFTEFTGHGIGLFGKAYVRFSFFDIDNDNDKDLVRTFRSGTIGSTGQLIVYRNDGTGVFSGVFNYGPSNGAQDGDIDFADIDGDSDIDFLFVGSGNDNIPIADIFLNDGSGNFTVVSNSGLMGARYHSQIEIGDIDGDNVLEIILSGQDSLNNKITKLYDQCSPILSTYTVSSCVSYTWIDGQTYTASNNTATHVIPNGSYYGCDSTVQLDLTIFPLPTVGVNTLPSTTVCHGEMVTLQGTGASTYVWDNGVSNNVPFMTTSSHTYNVTGTDVNGCVNNSSITITVNPNPVGVASIGNIVKNPICLKDNPVPLPVGIPAGGAFSGAGVVGSNFNPDQSGGIGFKDLHYIYSDANGCKDTATLSIQVVESPSFSYSTNGNSVTLNSTSSCANFTWDFGDGNTNNFNTNPSHTFSVDGIYSICLICNDGPQCVNCINLTFPSNISGSVNGTIGIEEVAIQNEIVVFPNPFTSTLSISLSSIQDAKYSIYTIDGKLILSGKLLNYITEVDLSNYENGVYFIEIENNKKRHINKLVKN